ncbi:MAG TPA: hypothetical protein PK110_10485 [Niabella sp.]|nr:hypothetical protein [Niabella sp.]
MKKITTVAIFILSIGIISCSKKDKIDDKTGLENTKWQTRDYVGEIVYGKNVYSIIEFIDKTKMQTIQKRETSLFAGIDAYQGTYYIKKDSVYWQTSNDEDLQSGKVVGSYLYRNMGKASDKYVYQKQ